MWRDVAESVIATGRQRWVVPQAYRTVQLNRKALDGILSRAPREFSVPVKNSSAGIELPMPQGKFARFAIVESPIMEPGLAEKFPEIKTYLGQGIDDPTATLRFDVTPQGFHAQVLSAQGDFYIDPYQREDVENYISYFKSDYRNDAKRVFCGVTERDQETLTSSVAPLNPSGATLRTYRLACAATGEYTSFHGGTVTLGQAAIVTSINRVNGIYEREVAVRMVLIANNNSLVYTNGATDPYTNNDGFSMLGQNQSNVDLVIGNTNYDIGHVFSTGGGGIASLGSVCVASRKAQGVTGLSAPVGDPFDVDYVAHEIGHQYNGRHTFNSTTGSCNGNRSATAAYEVGSGTTIQAYAGICGADNLQSNSNAYFHTFSFQEIFNFTNTGSGNSCPTATASGNTPPTIGALSNFTIPQQTPFALTATANDVDGDALTYCWEEFDLGAAQSAARPFIDNGSSPIFRSFNPTTSPTRTFPSLTYILNNANDPNAASGVPGETLPNTNRTMNFRVTVRDNRAGGGGVRNASMQVTVSTAAGPFQVTFPNAAGSLSGAQTVTWNVAGTNAAPINTANVNILLSTDGGNTFPTVLAANTPNDGAQSVTLPNITTTTARIRIEAVGNVYFDVSNVNFSIQPVAVTLTQFYPVAATTGRTITITGTGFVPGNTQVFFGGTRLIPATVLSGGTSTQLQVTVPASTTGTGNINGFITVQVGATSVDTQGLAQNAANPGVGTATFPEFVLWGDYNGDGVFNGVDVTFSRAAFLGQIAAPTARQQLAVDVSPANGNGSRGDGSFVGIDVTLLRALFLGQIIF